MTLKTFTKMSKKLGYDVKPSQITDIGLFSYECTNVIDPQNRIVAKILEDRTGSYQLDSPAPKSSECELIDKYAFTSLTKRNQLALA